MAGKPFSEVVSQAKAQGFTEPDPRDDLAGMDVARKVTILARHAREARTLCWTVAVLVLWLLRQLWALCAGSVTSPGATEQSSSRLATSVTGLLLVACAAPPL